MSVQSAMALHRRPNRKYFRDYGRGVNECVVVSRSGECIVEEALKRRTSRLTARLRIKYGESSSLNLATQPALRSNGTGAHSPRLHLSSSFCCLEIPDTLVHGASELALCATPSQTPVMASWLAEAGGRATRPCQDSECEMACEGGAYIKWEYGYETKPQPQGTTRLVRGSHGARVAASAQKRRGGNPAGRAWGTVEVGIAPMGGRRTPPDEKDGQSGSMHAVSPTNAPR